MKKCSLFLLTCLWFVQGYAGSVSEYNAYSAYLKNDFASAVDVYTKVLEADPYDAIANYNMGTALYKQQCFEDANNYFARAAQSEDNKRLQEQTLFNQGNSLVQLKKYEDAIEAYEKVLEINTNNEQAKHNLEIVKQLLEQQKQQEENKQNQDSQSQDQQNNDQQDQDSKNQDSKDQNKDSQNQKSENKDSKKQDSQNQNKQQSEKQKSEEKQSEDQQSSDQKEQESKDQDAQSQENKQGDDLKDQQKQSDGDKDRKVENRDAEQRNSDGKAEDKSKQLEKAKNSEAREEEKQHATSPEKANQQENANIAAEENKDEKAGIEEDNKLEDAFAAKMDINSQNDERLNEKDAKLFALFNEQEDKIQKKLLQVNVTNKGNVKHGQKNW